MGKKKSEIFPPRRNKPARFDRKKTKVREGGVQPSLLVDQNTSGKKEKERGLL